MKSKREPLLVIDGLVNLVLGILLLLFPVGAAEILGVPAFKTGFYPSILGAVLFGIGIALLLERFGASKNIRGLGLDGAIVINVCGAGALLLWLVLAPPAMPLRGFVILGAVAVVVLVLGFVESIMK